MALDAVKNFASAKLARGYGQTANVVELEAGEGVKFPDPAVEGEYNLVWWNETDYSEPVTDPEVEIVRVTGKTGDILTILRAQENTEATIKNRTGKEYRFILTLTAKVIDDIKAKFEASEPDNEELFSTAPDKMIASEDITKGDLLKLTEGEFAKVAKIESDFTQITPDPEYIIENNNISNTKSVKYADNKIFVAIYKGTSIYGYTVENTSGTLVKSKEYLIANSGHSLFDLTLTDEGNVILFSGYGSTIFGKVIDPNDECKIISSASMGTSFGTSDGLIVNKGLDGEFIVLQSRGSSSYVTVWKYENEFLEYKIQLSFLTGANHYTKTIDMVHHKGDQFLISYVDQSNNLITKMMRCSTNDIKEIDSISYTYSSYYNYSNHTFLEKVGEDRFLLVHNTYSFYLSIVDGRILYSNAELQLNNQPEMMNKTGDSIVVANRNGYLNQVILVSIENGKISGKTEYKHKYHQLVWAEELTAGKVFAHYKQNDTNYGYLCAIDLEQKENNSTYEYASFVEDIDKHFTHEQLPLSQGNYSYRIAELGTNKAVLTYLKKDESSRYSISARILEKTAEGIVEKNEITVSNYYTSFNSDKKDFLQVLPLSEDRFVIYAIQESSNSIYGYECSFDINNEITAKSPVLIGSSLERSYGFRAKLIAPDTVASIHSGSGTYHYSVLNVVKFPKDQSLVNIINQDAVAGYSINSYQYSPEICLIDDSNFIVSYFTGSHTYGKHYTISGDTITKDNDYFLVNSHCSYSIETIQDSAGYFFLTRPNEVNLFHFDGSAVTKKDTLSHTDIGSDFHSISKIGDDIILSYTNKISGCLVFKRNLDKIEVVKDLSYEKKPSAIDGYSLDSLVWDNAFYQLYSDSGTDISVFNLDLSKPGITSNVFGSVDAMKYIRLNSNEILYALTKDKNLKLVLYKQDADKRKIVAEKIYTYSGYLNGYSITKLDASRFVVSFVDLIDVKKICIKLLKFDGISLIELKSFETILTTTVSIVKTEKVNTDKIILYSYSDNSKAQVVKFENNLITAGAVKELTLTVSYMEMAYCSSNKVLVGFTSNDKVRNCLLIANSDMTITESAVNEQPTLTGSSFSGFKMYSLTDDRILINYNGTGRRLALIKNIDDDNRSIISDFEIGNQINSIDISENNNWTVTQYYSNLTANENLVRHYKLSDSKDIIQSLKTFSFGRTGSDYEKVLEYNGQYLQLGQSDNIFYSNLVDLSKGVQKYESTNIKRMASDFYKSPVCRYNENLKLQMSTQDSTTKLYLTNIHTEEVIDSTDLFSAVFTFGGIHKLGNGRVVLYYTLSGSSKIQVRLCDVLDNKIVLRDITETSLSPYHSYYSSVWEIDDSSFYLCYNNSSHGHTYCDKFFIEGRELKKSTYFQDNSYCPIKPLQFSTDKKSCIGHNNTKLTIYQLNNGTINLASGTKPDISSVRDASIDRNGDEVLVGVGTNTETSVFRQQFDEHIAKADIDTRALKFSETANAVKVSYISDELALCYRIVGTKLLVDLLKLGEGTEITLFHSLELDYKMLKDQIFEAEANKLSIKYIDIHTGQFKFDEINFPDIWNYYGYAQETAAKDASVSVAGQGKISSIHEGLRPASNYFVDPVTLKPTTKTNSFDLGMSLDQNRVLLKMPAGLKQFILDNTMD